MHINQRRHLYLFLLNITRVHDWNDTPEAAVEEFADDVLSDFDDRNGIGSAGYDEASKYIPDFYESVSSIGRERTGILELYMLAFKLAQKQLKQQAN